MADQEVEVAESYLSDRPLDGKLADLETVDLFGWGRHAERIAKAILVNSKETGFVVGLHGSWGSGKSTLMNFVEAKVKQLDESITVFRYNPWLYPEVNHVQNFFSELSKAIQFRGKGWHRSRLSVLLSRVANYTDAGGRVADGLRLVFLTIFLASFLGGTTGSATGGWQITLIVLSLLSLGLGTWSKALVGLACALSAPGAATKTLADLKNEINSNLKKSERRIVVLIDDIDRLRPDDICEVFQLVKNNGDLANVTYLLSFDKEIVQSVLSSEYVAQYQSFTDKIVQLEFGIPAPDRGQLERFFVNELDTLLRRLAGSEALDEQWDVERWSNNFHWHVRGFLHSVRDAKRVLNGIRLGLGLVLRDGRFEVDPVDFVLVEILRIQFPEIHDFLKHNKNLLIHTTIPTAIFPATDNEKQVLESRYETFLASLPDSAPRANIQELMGSLFPKLTTLGKLGASDYTPTDEERASSRICTEEAFDRFFIYGNYVGDLSNAFVRHVSERIRTRQNVLEMIDKLRGTDRLRYLVDQLKVRSVSLEERGLYLQNLLTFILDVSDYLPETDETIYTLPIRFFIVNTIRELLEFLPPESRAMVLQQAFAESSGLFGPIVLTAIISRGYDKDPQADHIIPPESIKNLVSAATSKGRRWLESDTLVTHRHMRAMLSCLLDWLEPADLKRALDRVTLDERHLKSFVTHFLIRSETRKMGAVAGRLEYRYDFEGMRKYCDLESIYSRVLSVDIKDTDSFEAKTAMELFKKEYPRYRTQQER